MDRLPAGFILPKNPSPEPAPRLTTKSSSPPFVSSIGYVVPHVPLPPRPPREKGGDISPSSLSRSPSALGRTASKTLHPPPPPRVTLEEMYAKEAELAAVKNSTRRKSGGPIKIKTSSVILNNERAVELSSSPPPPPPTLSPPPGSSSGVGDWGSGGIKQRNTESPKKSPPQESSRLRSPPSPNPPSSASLSQELQSKMLAATSFFDEVGDEEAVVVENTSTDEKTATPPASPKVTGGLLNVQRSINVDGEVGEGFHANSSSVQESDLSGMESEHDRVPPLDSPIDSPVSVSKIAMAAAQRARQDHQGGNSPSVIVINTFVADSASGVGSLEGPPIDEGSLTQQQQTLHIDIHADPTAGDGGVGDKHQGSPTPSPVDTPKPMLNPLLIESDKATRKAVKAVGTALVASGVCCSAWGIGDSKQKIVKAPKPPPLPHQPPSAFSGSGAQVKVVPNTAPIGEEEDVSQGSDQGSYSFNPLMTTQQQ